MKTVANAVLGFVLLMFLVPTVQAGTPRTLEWDDLAPSMEDLSSLFEHLPDDQMADLNDLYSLIQWRKDIAKDDSEYDSIGGEIEALKKSLVDYDLDAEKLLETFDTAVTEYKRRSNQPIRNLDGEDIRLLGYVLPLEFDGRAVKEFFLVPYVGACIHTPPPSANQIVLVRLKQSYKPEGLYDAVWVSGNMKIVKSEHQLGYSDGVGAVTSTYQLDGTRITPFD